VNPAIYEGIYYGKAAHIHVDVIMAHLKKIPWPIRNLGTFSMLPSDVMVITDKYRLE
jgi:hypothetical protein